MDHLMNFSDCSNKIEEKQPKKNVSRDCVCVEREEGLVS